MTQRITQVDAFADKPFSGNPAAVCVMRGPADEHWMQSVALEMNLSETAFLYPEKEHYALRWFTPAAEVELCGHATLASAHVLWEEEYLSEREQARFMTKSGLLTAKKGGDIIELSLPAKAIQEARPIEELLAALGVTAVAAGRSEFDYLVEVDSEETVRGLKPDFGALMQLPSRGFIVTSKAATPRYDFVSRFFAPSLGINEDPVTGAAHCCLGPYWQTRLGKSKFVAYQASARGGVVHVQVDGDRVLLGGRAVTVMRGELV
jgi:PhzF family phenazine biosynthesis protein